ncbi:PQQ-binding-like beta-propeller repeat protein [Streptomyces sp. NPDC017991]|uniref:serine/threonine-protein kinase n=1 Tax=Streptomyces sp. NPDC017991 TaxID=3365026 RepID=UPI0037A0082D
MSLSLSGDGSADASIGGYTLIKRLGSGSMGVVHLGLSASGRQVALKVVHAQYALDEEFRTRFRQEVAAVRRVSGAFTPPVVDADPDAELPWMATLYVPGRTLYDTIAEQGPLSGRALRALALGLTDALRDIHRAGVVHRDLKPSNILMAEDGPRVIDFGISRAADNEDLTFTGRLIGTPPFMSPEQFASPKEITGASDVFSLGSVLVYAATGNRPFDGGSPYVTVQQVMHDQPRLDGVEGPLRRIAGRCLAKNPADRPELAELHRLLLQLPTDDLLTQPHSGSVPALRDSSHPASAPGTGIPPGSTAYKADGTAARRGTHHVRRIFVTLGSVMAITTIGITATHFVSANGATRDSVSPGSSANGTARPELVLPAGWQPWRASLLTGKKDESVDYLESGCVSGGASAVYCAGTGFTVTKLDTASGRVLWRHGISPQTSRPVGVRDGHVYTYRKPKPTPAYVTRRLVALDERTGRELWARPVNEDEPAALFDQGIVAMDENKTAFVAYDKTGRQLWTSPAKSSAGNACTPTVLDGAPYGLCTPVDGPSQGDIALLRLDPDDGTSQEIASLSTGAQPMGTVDGQLLFLVPKLEAQQFGSNGDDQPYTALERVDPRTGVVERVSLPDTPRGTPRLVKDVLCFVRPDGTVTTTRVTDGKRLWQRVTEVESLSTPVWSKKSDTLFLASRYGRLLALNRATGTVRWRIPAISDPGESAAQTTPYLLQVEDAIVAVAGDTAFSVRPDRPAIAPK